MVAVIMHSTQQQHPHKHVNLTQTWDKTEHLPGKTSHTHIPKQPHKMGDLHLFITADQKITNIFKHTDIKITFKCDNTISQLSKPTNRTPPPCPMTSPASTSFPA
jgi:hypothetical protein